MYTTLKVTLALSAMPALEYPDPDCNHVTDNVGTAAAVVYLKYHLETVRNHNRPATTDRHSKLKPEKPRITAGALSEDWSHFTQVWATYKNICQVNNENANESCWNSVTRTAKTSVSARQCQDIYGFLAAPSSPTISPSAGPRRSRTS